MWTPSYRIRVRVADVTLTFLFLEWGDRAHHTIHYVSLLMIAFKKFKTVE